MVMTQLRKIKNSESKIICLFSQRSIKKSEMNRHVQDLQSRFSYTSILGQGSFCMNYCFNAARHGGDQSVALLRHY